MAGFAALGALFESVVGFEEIAADLDFEEAAADAVEVSVLMSFDELDPVSLLVAAAGCLV